MPNELVIDSMSFARKSESLQGKIAVNRLERVREDLASPQGEIEFRLQGEMDGRERPCLRLSIVGRVMLTCQRCLGELDYELNLRSQLVLVTNEAALPDLDEESDDIDFIVANSKLNVLDLLQDEIILGLPLAAKHEYDCAA